MTRPGEEGLCIWANGQMHAAGTPVIAAEDQGFLLGLSVFDTLLLDEGHVLFQEEHLARMRSGAQGIGIPWPPPWDPAQAIAATAASVREQIGTLACALRVTLTRGVPGGRPCMVVTPRRVTALPPEGVRAYVAPYLKLGGDSLEAFKTTNRLRNILAREAAMQRGAWEALLRNHQGDFSEGTISNLWIVRDGMIETPPQSRGCLAGVVRTLLLASLREEPLISVDGKAWGLRETPMEFADLEQASEVFLTNTTGRVIGVVEVCFDDREPLNYPGGAGIVAQGLQQRMTELERKDRAKCSVGG